jgi:O-antigen/teichoic acid export membrane protein
VKSVHKVVFNTGILYVKMVLTMGISLYSTPLLLNALGDSDYGIFQLIAGVVAMLSFLNAAMTTSTQRFMSYYQGRKDISRQKMIFTNSCILHIVIGVIIVAALELLSPIIFSGFLNIPTERIHTAQVIFLFMSIAMFFNIITVPFTASLNAHENMLWIAIVNIIESILRLWIAISLLYFIRTDKLIIYGLFTAGLSAISFFLHAGFCLRKYEECYLQWHVIDKQLMKKLGSFAGWNLFGTLCGLGRTQGIAVLLNLFFGTVINAAYGIAIQVSGQLNFFSASMLQVLNPQIMKSEGMNDRKRMLRLSMIASKFSFFLLAVLAIPCIFEMSTILQLWLKNVPEYTIIFCSMILIAALTNQLTIGLQSAVQATGKIKIYQTIVGGIILCNLPIVYFLLKMNFPVYFVFIGMIGIESIACLSRLFFIKKLAGLSIKEYFNKVFLKELFPVGITTLVCFGITSLINGQFRFVLTICVAIIIFLSSVYLWGLCMDEKEIIHNFLKNRKR